MSRSLRGSRSLENLKEAWGANIPSVSPQVK